MSILPLDTFEFGLIALPEVETVMMRVNHMPKPIRLTRKTRLIEKTSNRTRDVIRAHIEPNKAVARMAENRAEKILIKCEKRHAPLSVQQRDDFGIFDAAPGYVASDVAKWNVPLLQTRQLVFREVFVQKIQAATSSESFRATRSRSPSQAV